MADKRSTGTLCFTAAWGAFSVGWLVYDDRAAEKLELLDEDYRSTGGDLRSGHADRLHEAGAQVSADVLPRNRVEHEPL